MEKEYTWNDSLTKSTLTFLWPEEKSTYQRIIRLPFAVFGIIMFLPIALLVDISISL